MDSFGKYPSGNKVTEKPEILFARMDLKEVMEKVEAMQAEAAKANAAEGEAENKEPEAVIDLEAKPEITYDDFAEAAVPGRRDYRLRSSKEVQKTALQPG